MDNNFEKLERRIREADPANKSNIILGEQILTKAIKEGTSRTFKGNRFKLTALSGLATASVAAVALVGLNVNGFNTSNDDILLNLSGEQRAGQENAVAGSPESGTADKSMLWFPNYNYIYIAGDELSKESGKGNAYKFVLAGTPERELEKLAKSFNLKGDVIQDPYGYDKLNWSIGDSNNYAEPILNIYWTGMGSWYYSNSSANTSSSTGCPVDLGSVSSDGSVSANEGDDLYSDCKIIPPTGLPTDKEALDKAYSILTSTGAELDKANLTVSSDEWGVYVSGNKKVEGQEVDVNFSVSWSGPEIAYASGSLAKIELVKEVPLISAYDAVDRASDSIWFGSYPYNMGIGAGSPMGVSKAEPALIDPNSILDSDNPSAGEENVSEGSAKGSEPSAGEEWVAPKAEDLEVVFNKSVKRLLLVWDANGTPWLLPGYTYSTEVKEYFGNVSIVAVDSRVINLSR